MKEKIIEDYKKAMPLAHISKKYGISVYKIKKILEEYGYKNALSKKQLLEKYKDEIVDKIVNKNMSANKICNDYGVSRETILRKLKEWNIEPTLQKRMEKYKEQCINLYNEGMSITRISKELKLPQGTLLIKMKEWLGDVRQPGEYTRIDYTNRVLKSGIKVLRYSGYSTTYGRPIWVCLCPHCNKEFTTSSVEIQKNEIKSCGCVKSYGELIVSKILDENNIEYKKQYFVRINNEKRFFDFAILDDKQEVKYFIEFDGEQHYEDFKDRDFYDYDKIHQRDIDKDNWCAKNNIPLIRIPYWKRDSLTIDDLLLKKD